MAENNQGIICECDDFDGYVESFERLINDPSLRDEMGRRGRESVEKTFNISSVVDKIEENYLSS